MHIDGFRVALPGRHCGTGFPSSSCHHRLASGTRAPGASELRIPVLATFQRLAIGLEAVPQIVEQPVHRALADALDRKTVRQRHCDTAANSPDRRASSVQARAPPPNPDPLRPPPGRRKHPEGISLEDSESSSSGANGAHPRRLGHSPDGTGRRPQAPRAFVQNRTQHHKFGSQRIDHSIHDIINGRSTPKNNLFWRGTLLPVSLAHPPGRPPHGHSVRSP